MNKIYTFIFFSLISFSNISFANEIFIESEELVIKNYPLTNTFIGNVYAYDKEIKLWSDKILVLYTENNQIYQIKGFGNTKLIRKDQKVLCENIIYHVIDKKIFASGDISVTQDKNIIEGNQLMIDLVKSTSIIKGNNENRVTVKIENYE